MKNTRQALAALLLALLAAAALLFAAGCSDSDDSSSSSLAGTTWEFISEPEGYEYIYTLYFSSNGTFTVSESKVTGDSTEDYGVSIGGNWSLSGTTLTLTITKNGYSINSITTTYDGGDTITTTGLYTDETETMIFTRVS